MEPDPGIFAGGVDRGGRLVGLCRAAADLRGISGPADQRTRDWRPRQPARHLHHRRGRRVAAPQRLVLRKSVSGRLVLGARRSIKLINTHYSFLIYLTYK